MIEHSFQSLKLLNMNSNCYTNYIKYCAEISQYIIVILKLSIHIHILVLVIVL